MNISETQLREIKFLENIPIPANINSLHDTIDQASIFMDRSLVLIDLSFHVIAYSKSVPITDPIWVNNIKRKYCTYKFINAVSKLISYEAISRPGDSHFINCTESEENKLCATLFVENTPIGYLILLDNNKGIHAYHLEYLPRIAHMISSNLKNLPDFYALFIDKTEEYLESLLNANTNSDAYIDFTKQHPKPENMKLPDNMRCLVIIPKSISDHDLFYIRRELRKAYSSGFFFVHNKQLVAIVSENILKSIENYLIEETFINIISHIGVSKVFLSLKEFTRQYGHAKEAIELANNRNSKNIIHKYEDIEFYNIIKNVNDQKLLQEYMHPSINLLSNYDLEHGSALLDTLGEYLSHGLNSKETAGALFLHRNTLSYRLSKIKEITGLTFENSEENFKLNFSMYIYRYFQNNV